MPVAQSNPINPPTLAEARGPAPARSLAALGALLGAGAIVSSSCCVLPLALALAGIGGAWTGEIAALAPAKPYLLAAGGLVLAGAWAMYLRRRVVDASGRACAVGGGCAPKARRRFVPVLLSLATLLFALAASWGWIEPGLLAWLMEQQS
jgi:mercuric ion transport protein